MSQSFFKQASHITIHGKTVNFVAGNQHTNVNQLVSNEGEESVMLPGALGHSILDEYRIIRRGDLCLLREISSQDIYGVPFQRSWHRDNKTAKALAFKRTIYRASIIGNRDIGECLAVNYSGRDGHKAWEQDFMLFSNHHPNIAHLFGLNLSSPTLIFCKELIPVRHLWEMSSAIVKCYIAHRVTQDLRVSRAYEQFMPPGVYNDIDYTFLQPHTNLACIGLPTTLSKNYIGLYSKGNAEEPEPLPLKFYSDINLTIGHLLKWTIKHISPELAVQKFISSALHTGLYETDLPASLPFIETSSSQTVYFKNIDVDLDGFNKSHLASSPYRSRNALTITPTIGYWYHTHRYNGDKLPQTITANGWTRISYFSYRAFSSWKDDCGHDTFDCLRCIVGISTKDKELLHTAWLSQGLYFTNLWDKKESHISNLKITTDIWIELQPKPGYVDWHGSPYIPAKYPEIFLFIAPVLISKAPNYPGMSVNWGNNGNDVYYWSFDPAGAHRISPWLAEALGLPKLVEKIWNSRHVFEDYQYEATRQFQKLRGYDPLTQEFAKKHGLPLIDIVEPPPDEDGDVWYDAEEGLDPSKDLDRCTPGFLVPNATIQRQIELNDNLSKCWSCYRKVRKCSSWLHGFLPYDLNRWYYELVYEYGTYGWIRWSCDPLDEEKDIDTKCGRVRGRRKSF